MMADILDILILYIKFKFVIKFWSFAIPSIPVEKEERTGMLGGTLVAFCVLHISFFSADAMRSA